MERRRSGRGGWGRDLGIFPTQRAKIGAKNREKPSNLVGLTGVLFRNPLEENGLRRYRGLWDLHGYFAGSLFGLEGYVRIRTCGTYGRLSQFLAPFADVSRVAPHVVGMLLAVAALVFNARSVLFLLLLRIGTAEVVWILGPP